MSEELATQEQAAAELAEAEKSVLADVQGDLQGVRLTVPLLKVVQGTTRDAPEDAQLGEFFNSLTGETFGKSVELIVSRFNYGRLYSPSKERIAAGEEDKTFVAGPGDVAPDNWPEQYRGRRWVDIEDAEETYRELANPGPNGEAPRIEWGDGPPISTTYNFTGYIRGSEVPIRLSLKRADTKTAQKMVTLMRAQRAPWDKTLVVSSSKVTKGDRTWQALSASFGEPTTVEEKSAAVQLAIQMGQIEVVEAGHDEAVVEEPVATPEGALET